MSGAGGAALQGKFQRLCFVELRGLNEIESNGSRDAGGGRASEPCCI